MKNPIIALAILNFLFLQLSFGQFIDNCDPGASNGSTWELTCGDSDSWNNSNNNSGGMTTNDTNTYSPCQTGNYGWTGPEYKYYFSAPYNGTFIFSLDILSNVDLDLLILGSCDNNNCISTDGATSSTSFESATLNLQQGEVIIAVVDGWLGATGDYNFSISCIAGTDCDSGDINCGETNVYSNVNSGNDIDWTLNNCVNSGYNGNDLIIKFERTSDYVTNWITLWNYSLEDIDLFILDDCPFNDANKSQGLSCIASSTNIPKSCGGTPYNFESISLSNHPSGTYYILIDGKSSNDSESQIFLSLSCEGLNCDDYMPISCNEKSTSSNVGLTNRSSNYYSCYDGSGCFNWEGSWTSGEKIFKFTAPKDGEYSFCMDPSGNIDLELFLFNSCCSTTWDPGAGYEVITDFSCYNNCERAETSGAGITERINNYYMYENEMVWIIVDGFLGDEGTFTMEVKCNTLDCNDLFSLSCGISFDDSNVPGNTVETHTGTYDIFDDHDVCNDESDGCKLEGFPLSTTFGRHEVIYLFEGNQSNGDDVVFDIFPRESDLDVDLFVYEICSSGSLTDCAYSSSFGPGKNDAIIIEDASIHSNYFVVVDGQSGLNNNTEGRYGFSTTCGELEHHNPQVIHCDTPIFGNTSMSVNYTSYYCNCSNDSSDVSGGGNNGKELVYYFDLQQETDVKIILDDFGSKDLELYLLETLDVFKCHKNSRNPAGQDEIIETRLLAGRYFIIVEGYDGSEGPFRLILEGCSDACAVTSNYFCETFENYTTQIGISSQSNDWSFDILGFNEQDCKVLGKSNGNKVLKVARDGNTNCSSALKVNDNSGKDVIELSFDLVMPYYNFGSTTLKADGAEIIVFEEDQNSNDQIYLAFRPYSLDPQNDDRTINLIITDKYFSPNADEPNAFNRNSINRISFRLQKSTETVWVFINDQLVTTASNTGLESLGMIGFRSEFNANEGFEIDNICLDSCEPCPDDEWYITDSEGNYPCDDIHVTGLQLMDDGAYTLNAVPGESINGIFSHWEVRDADSEEIIFQDDLNESSLSYCCHLPGKKIYVCYWYYDEYGCLKHCCIKIHIPVNCNFINPYYNGDETNLSYNISAENLENDQSIIAWFTDESSEVYSNDVSITLVPETTGTRRVCCLIYDPFLRCYIICCRTICVEYPFGCNQISVDYNTTEETFRLSTNINSTFGDWYLDSPVQLNLGSANPLIFDPKDYNLSLAQSFVFSYRYIDTDGCTRYCCKRVTRPNTNDALILSIGESCGAPGSTVSVPVRCQNFDMLAQGSMSIVVENEFAKILGITNVSLPQSMVNNSFDDQTEILIWFNIHGTDISIPDNSILFYIELELLGNNLNEAEINIIDYPTDLEFTGTNSIPVPIIVEPGKVCLSEKIILSGKIAKENNIPVHQATVHLESNFQDSTLTDQSGIYSFEVNSNEDYTIKPKKNGDDRNGVKGLDLLLLQRHLLYIDRFDSPYQLIAADLNNDGTVKGSDLLLLQRFLLFITPQFEFVDSWRFVDKKHVFNPTTPDIKTFPEEIELMNVSSDRTDLDFVGIKMGDFDYSASSFLSNEFPTKNLCHEFIVDNKDLVANESVEIEFKAMNFSDLAVITAEIKFDNTKLEFEGFVDSVLDGMSTVNVSTALANQGYLLINWVSQTGYGVNLMDDANIFTLKFKANEQVKIGDVISFTNDFISTEVVDGNLVTNCLELKLNNTSSTKSTDLNEQIITSVYPNPLGQENLNFRILINQNENYTLSIFDPFGKIIYSESGILFSTDNIIRLDRSQIDMNSGIYFYKIKIADTQHSGRLILIQ